MSSQDLSKLFKSLITVTDLDEVKQRVRQLWKEGQLEKSQAAKLIRKWRSLQWQEKQKQNKEMLINNLSARLDSTEEQTLDDIKQLINEYVMSGKITYKDGGFLIKKWRKRESRRINRQSEKGSNSCCFFCRQTGHKFSECPEKDGEMMGSGICFKCGSTEHTSSRCHRKNVRGFPYATCFVCKQQGHLSRDCDKNANGIYPDGGSCNLCGSQKHLRKDCPLKKGADGNSQRESLVAARNNATGGDDDVLNVESNTESSRAKKMKLERKVVRI
ncbi:zinc knuckle [Onchocerca flexuosa]|uniref:Zinc knuckle n=1 Tax=Onchocerca flexuosa TaxID=387005 RepID=A0A238BNX8_9BILA|nr:zinc knuckle [Onchocerca flexuosa]